MIETALDYFIIICVAFDCFGFFTLNCVIILLQIDFRYSYEYIDYTVVTVRTFLKLTSGTDLSKVNVI